MTRAFPRGPLAREFLLLLGAWRVRIWFIVLLLFSGLLLTIPLFNVLGFEFALASTVPLTFAAAHLGATAVDVARRHQMDWPNESGARLAARRLAASLLVLALYLLIPIAAGLLGAFFILNCNLARGLALFALLPVPGALLALTLGHALAALIPRRVWPMVAFVLLALTTAGFALFTFITEPTIALYNPFVGYYPGSLYDERIESSVALLAYRATTIVLAAGIAVAVIAAYDAEASRLRLASLKRHRLLYVISALLLASVAAVYVSGGHIGFSVTRRDIERELSESFESTRATIHFAANSPTARSIRRIAAEHDFQVAEIEKRLGISFPDRIHSYIYPDAETKARLMGARNTYIAKPWLREIHIQHQTFPHPILRHELTHVIAGAFAPTPFRVSQKNLFTFNIGLIEGLAVAVDWADDRLTPHHAAAAIHRLPRFRAPRIESMLSVGGFWAHTPSLAYTLVGSFVRHLAETHTWDKVRDLYSDGDFVRVFSRPLNDLGREWERFLSAVPLSKADLNAAELRFRRPSIFHRPCPHEVAALKHEASLDNQAGRTECALGHIDAAHRLEPDEPTHLRDRLTLQLRLGRDDDATRTFAEILAHPKTSAYLRGELREEAGDRAWIRGDHARADAEFRAVLELALSYDSERRQTVRLAALSTPAIEAPIRSLLLGQGSLESRIDGLRRGSAANPTNAILPYLWGRQEWNRARWKDALPPLLDARRRGLPTDALRFETERLIGIAKFELGAYDDAIPHFTAVVESSLAPGVTANAADWIARCRFFRSSPIAKGESR